MAKDSEITRGWLWVLILSGLLITPQVLRGAEPLTWPRADGPEHNRVSREIRMPLIWSKTSDLSPATKLQTDLLETEDPQPGERPELWEIEGLHGYGEPLIFNDKLYFLHQETGPQSVSQQEDSVLSIDGWYVSERDPEARFRYELPPLSERQIELGQQPRLVGDSVWRQLFCLTPGGELLALDSDLGNLLWKVSLVDLLQQPQAPLCIATPLVFEHLLIVPACWETAQGEGTLSTLVAFDRRNGQVCWFSERESSESGLPRADPVPLVYNQQVLLASQCLPGSVQLVQIRTGKPIADIALNSKQAIAQELLYEGNSLVVLSTSELAQADTEKGNDASTEVDWSIEVFDLTEPSESAADSPLRRQAFWQIDNQTHVTTLLIDEQIFAATSRGELFCYALTQSKPVQTLPLAGKSEHWLNWLDRQLLVTDREGHWEVFLTAPTAAGSSEKEKEHSRVPQDNFQVEKVFGEKWEAALVGLPVVAKQRVYVRTDRSLMALGPIDNQRAVSDLIVTLPDLAQETEDKTPGALCLIPAMKTLQPGFKLQFQTLLFNRSGAYLETLPADQGEWIWSGPGELLKESGTLTLPGNSPAGSELKLQRSWNQLNATSQIRVVEP